MLEEMFPPRHADLSGGILPKRPDFPTSLEMTAQGDSKRRRGVNDSPQAVNNSKKTRN
jgi:hypothetical protein